MYPAIRQIRKAPRRPSKLLLAGLLDGATGTKIINDLIAGKTDADELLLHYHRKIKATKEAFRKAFGRSAYRSPSIYAQAHSTKY